MSDGERRKANLHEQRPDMPVPTIYKLERCGKKYGRGLVCRRWKGHKGFHAVRLTVGDLNQTLKEKGFR